MTLRSPDAPPPRPGPFSPDDIVRSGLCIGCGACVGADRTGRSVMLADVHGQLKPSGPRAWRKTRSPEFSAVCPFSPAAADEDDIALARYPTAPLDDPRVGRFVSAWVGHAEEGQFRASGSSGGMANWTAAELMRTGRVDAVAHVGALRREAAEDPLFGYRISRSLAELGAAAKSRYHPVELSGVIDAIRARPGRYAVLGVPCFIKAVNLLRARDPVLAERIVFTLGLFCGHMKSGRMAESFAWQTGVRLAEVVGMDYRLKDPDRPANVYTAQFLLKDGGERRRDWWNFVDGDWGAGFFQNPACDWCDDVVAETADISFGDAWVEPYASDGRGTNVVVARTAELDGMLRGAIDAGRLRLEPVDADFIHRTQAAGFRQRREALAWRLAWPRPGRVHPRKRVAPRQGGLSWRRRGVYLMRRQISRWSPRLFELARRTRRPGLYLRWARGATGLYQALAWSRGRLGVLFDRLPSGERP